MSWHNFWYGHEKEEVYKNGPCGRCLYKRGESDDA